MKSNTQSKSGRRWYDERGWAFILGITTLLVSYGIGSRSLDTGSWQQYILTLIFLIFAVNRIIHAVKVKS